jgi:hypothetical protein
MYHPTFIYKILSIIFRYGNKIYEDASLGQSSPKSTQQSAEDLGSKTAAYTLQSMGKN